MTSASDGGALERLTRENESLQRTIASLSQEIDTLKNERDTLKQELENYQKWSLMHWVRLHPVWVMGSMLVTGLTAGFLVNNAIVDLTGQTRILETRLDELIAAEARLGEVEAIAAKCQKIEVTIVNPQEGEIIQNQQVPLEVDLSGKLQTGETLWVAVNPKGSKLWFPQERIPKQEGKWNSTVYFGSERGEYDLAIILANETARDRFNQYLEDVKDAIEHCNLNEDEETCKYPEIELPYGAEVLKDVNVIQE